MTKQKSDGSSILTVLKIIFYLLLIITLIGSIIGGFLLFDKFNDVDIKAVLDGDLTSLEDIGLLVSCDSDSECSELKIPSTCHESLKVCIPREGSQ